MRNILAHIPHKDKDAFAQNLKTIWLAPTREQARKLAEEICRRYEHRFSKAICCLEDGLEDSLSFYTFPQLDARKISSTNVLERLNREIRRRTRVVGSFPDDHSALMLVCARLRHVAGTQWGNKKYMNMKHLEAALEDVSIAG